VGSGGATTGCSVGVAGVLQAAKTTASNTKINFFISLLLYEFRKF
jgi:hypothetical protein